MQIDVIETTSLGDRSYLVSAGGVAVVIDPQRDIDRVLDLAAERGTSASRSSLETHVHNDYVTGGLELARTRRRRLRRAGRRHRRLRARPGGGRRRARRRARCGSGCCTPPGTPTTTSATSLTDADGAVQAVFTGGSMLYGSTGRTDLLGAEHTDELTHAQYHSVRRLADELPAGTAGLPHPRVRQLLLGDPDQRRRLHRRRAGARSTRRSPRTSSPSSTS